MSRAELEDARDTGRAVGARERVWSGPIFTVEDEELFLADGRAPVRRQTVAHHDAVSVVALREGRASAQGDGAAEILMVRQYRHPVRAMLWEVPAGLLDVPGEEPLVAAQRELAEETDFAAARWDVLVDFYASPGFTTEGARSYLARDLRPLPPSERVEREAEEAEFVPTWFRLDDVLDAVMAGRLHNPSTVVGVLAAARARSSGWAGLRPTDAGWLRSPRSLRAG